MIRRLAEKICLKVGCWLLRLANVELYPLPPAVTRMIGQARMLARGYETIDQPSEWKRHQVFARLVKSFPGCRKRDAALALEIAVRDL